MPTINQQKGLKYEFYIRDFIRSQLNKIAYLWNECPETILIENKLIPSHNHMRMQRKDIKGGMLHNHKDIGIDVIQLDQDNTHCNIVQCKNGYQKGLTVENISGIMMRAACMRNMNAFVYYTNKLSTNIQNILSESQYAELLDCSNDTSMLANISNDESKMYFVKLPFKKEPKNTENITSQQSITPYDYQIEALDKFKHHFQANNRGILSLPCGCGKTYTSYLISNEFDHIIIISPLREFASQNLNRYIQYGYDESKALLVDTDGVRDVDTVKSFINNNNKILLSCTYDSIDIISECLDIFQNALFIIDEFHNLSKANLSDDQNPMFKLLMSDHKIMFMSATPRVYELELDDEAYELEWLFGDIVYSMTMAEAIQNKYICDYRIWLPSIHENNDELNNELSIYDIDDHLKNRCKYLYSCIANNGSRKCIVYCADTEDMNYMIKCMKTLNEFYCMEIEISSITCKDSNTKRKDKLVNFSRQSDKIQVLFNIKILNECIDIPACDAVYISYVPYNKITTVQRICRANRLDSTNPYKIANIFIWCDEYTDIMDTLSSIKEYDVTFTKKININEINFYNKRSDKDKELVNKDIILINEYILGIKEFRQPDWTDKLEQLEEYIKENNKLPTRCSLDKSVHILGSWVSSQKANYKTKTKIMKKPKIRHQWEQLMSKYPVLFMSYQELWEYHLQEIEDYIKENNRMPKITIKDPNERILGKWIDTQKHNYDLEKDIMRLNTDVRKMWEEFNAKYETLIYSYEKVWKAKLNQVKSFIMKNNRLPLQSKGKKIEYSLALWIHSQLNLYQNGKHMKKNKEIRDLWEEFTERYSTLFT